MSRVLTDLDVRYVKDRPNGGKQWRLIKFYACESDALGIIRIPAGFDTDFNSTPRGLWNLLPPTEYGHAAVPHDWLYFMGRVGDRRITRHEADRVHREFLIWAGAPRWKVRAMYWGLRAGGWWAWNKYRRAERHKR